MAVAISERRFLYHPTVEEMPNIADVVIIGGGMAGPAASWALQREMPGIKTVLIEQGDQLSNGASKASIENFRTCWPTEALVAQMARSQEIYLHADEYLGDGAAESLNVKQRGYLYCGFTEQQAANLKKDVLDLQKMGLTRVEFLEATEVKYRYPWLGPNVVAAKVDPTAGWLDSNALSYQYAKNGREARFLLGISQPRIIVEGDRVIGVSTEKGTIHTRKIVIAAGAGSRGIGKTAGIEIPIILRPRQSFVTQFRDRDIPFDAPFIIGNNPSAYMRPAEDGGIFGWEYDWKNTVDPNNGKSDGSDGIEDYLDGKNGDSGRMEDYLIAPVQLEKVKDKRFPSVALDVLEKQFGKIFTDPRYMQGLKHQTGYYVYRSPENAYETQPDGSKKPYTSQRAIIDAWPGIEGLFLSVSHVGHGVMASAASGEIVAAHVLGNDLKNPLFYDFGLNVHWVPNDGGDL